MYYIYYLLFPTCSPLNLGHTGLTFFVDCALRGTLRHMVSPCHLTSKTKTMIYYELSPP